MTDAVFRTTVDGGPSDAQGHCNELDLRGRKRLSSVGFPGRLAPTLAAGDYIPFLDGLRAVSITLVVLGHFGFHIIPGIFGVTIFFFVSGYLITSQLLSEIDRRKTLDLKNFYMRRVLRLYPALLVMVGLGGGIYGALGGRITSRDVFAALFYAWNYYERFGGYQGGLPGGAPHPFAVLWSLAVEEHFYLVFPFLCLALGSARSRLAIIVGGLIIAVAAWRIEAAALCEQGGCVYLQIEHGTDTRADSVLYGALLTVLLASRFRPLTVRVCQLPAAFRAGAGLLLMSLLVRNSWFRDTLRFSFQGIGLFFCIGGLLVEPSLRRLRAVLSWSPVLLLGRWSYSLYLWHWIVLCVAWEIAPGRVTTLQGGGLVPHLVPLLTTLPALLGLSLLFAAASYYWIERPMLSLRRRFGSRAIGGKSRAFMPPIGSLTHAHVLDLSVGASHDSTM